MWKVDQKRNWIKLKSVQTLLRITCLANKKSLYMPMHVKSWPKVKMYQAEVCSNITKKCENFTKSEIYSNIPCTIQKIKPIKNSIIFDLTFKGHPRSNIMRSTEIPYIWLTICVSYTFLSWQARFRRYSPLKINYLDFIFKGHPRSKVMKSTERPYMTYYNIILCVS